MVSFESDYIAGAHPEIIKKLGETNFECLSRGTVLAGRAICVDR